MNITLKGTDSDQGNYISNFNCPIAKALRRKRIFSIVAPHSFQGLFLGIIPVFGYIPTKANDAAWDYSNYPQKSDKVVEVKLFYFF